MSKKIRNYTIVCPSCGGKGWISNPVSAASSTTITCPACNGSKVVLVTESEE
jgi:DnaJ-class molecular chaperone